MSTFDDSRHATPEQLAEAHRRVLATLVVAAGDEQAFELLLFAAHEAGAVIDHDEVSAELAVSEGAEVAFAYLALVASRLCRLLQRSNTKPTTAH